MKNGISLWNNRKAKKKTLQAKISKMIKQSRGIKRMIEEVYPNMKDSLMREIRYHLFTDKDFDFEIFKKKEEAFLSIPEWMRWSD